MSNLQLFKTKFQVESLTIINTGAWSWSVRPNQVTLGSGIISLNREALYLSDVTREEMAEFADLVKKVEKSLKTKFDFQIMNYLMFMMADHHVHYHVIPRYEGVRNFGNVEWVDNGWPVPPIMTDAQHKGDEELLLKIRDELKSAI